ncbi:MAG TPA: hypothetical protein VGS21_09020 [Acidimicrobiales bacterium]|nr:hypothetical protein [Acidimicrobiales bacterium]
MSSNVVRRRVLPVALSVAALVPLAAMLPGGASSAGASARTHRVATAHTSRVIVRRAAACPTTPGLPFTGSLANGTFKVGLIVNGSGIGGSVCGTLTPTTGGFKVSIPQSNFTFSGGNITILGLVSLPAVISADSNATGSAKATKNGLASTLNVSISSTVSLLGFTCTIGPFSPHLTTGRSGTLTGKNFTGSFTNLSGEFVANNFVVPAVQPTESCPLLVAGLINTTIGLPSWPGDASLTTDSTLAVT